MAALVGRQRELAAIDSGLDAALAGSGRAFLLAGEAGIGKTALASAARRAAEERGFVAVVARCWDGGGAPAYWPFIQLFRRLLEEHAAVSRPALARSPERAAKIGVLVPELVGGGSPLPAGVDATTRFALFDAAVGWLREIAKELPLFVALDDLHAVDPSSLSMLHFLAGELASARIVIVGSYRDRASGAGPEVIDLLARLGREATVVRLARLDREAVLAMMVASTGAAPPAIADLVFRTSEGVPLFVEEILRSLSLPGAAWLSGAPLPSGVRTVIKDRLVRLDEATLRVLETASVIGARFTLALIGMARADGDAGAEQIHDLVERAAAAEVVERLAPGRYAFAHAMIREALYRDIPGGTRAQIHAAVSTAIEQGRADGTLADRAHHALRAAPILGVARVVAIARAAADAALAVQAFEVAEELLRRAVAVLDVAATEEHLRAPLVAALAATRRFQAPEATSSASRSRGAGAAMTQDGELWAVRLGDDLVRLKDSRGLQMLAQLVEAPDREIHALTLCSAPGADLPAGDAGEALDREAIEAYRERQIEVEEELREAESWNDSARMDRARTEIEFLRGELARAVGLGGRSRRVASDAERARIDAQRRLRDALRRITEQSPEVGRHFERTIRTGTFCSYTPKRDD